VRCVRSMCSSWESAGLGMGPVAAGGPAMTDAPLNSSGAWDVTVAMV
jgi:hypothetical protein